MIRKATINDLGYATALGHNVFEFVGFKRFGLRYHPENFKRMCAGIIQNPNSVVLVVEEDDKIVGSIAGLIMPWILDFSQQIVLQLWWWVEEEYRKPKLAKEMLVTLAAWGKSRGAEFLTCAAVCSPQKDKMETLYYHHGFEFLESYYTRRI